MVHQSPLFRDCMSSAPKKSRSDECSRPRDAELLLTRGHLQSGCHVYSFPGSAWFLFLVASVFLSLPLPLPISQSKFPKNSKPLPLTEQSPSSKATLRWAALARHLLWPNPCLSCPKKGPVLLPVSAGRRVSETAGLYGTYQRVYILSST